MIIVILKVKDFLSGILMIGINLKEANSVQNLILRKLPLVDILGK